MSDPKSNTELFEEKKEELSGPTDIASVYIEIYSSLRRFVSRYLRRPHDIEDVVQEACVKALEAQNQREIHSPKSYLFRASKNLALKELAKSANRLTDNIGDLALETVVVDSQTLEEQFESRQKFELFCRAVRDLPVKCRRAFVLRKVYGFSQKEIAESLGISIKTVEAHLAKGIVRCTEYMEAGQVMTEQSGSNAKGQQRNG